MPDIASLLNEFRMQNVNLGANLRAKGVYASSGDGLKTLAEKVRTINQNIANGTKKTMRVSAAGSVKSGDFVSIVDELVPVAELNAESGTLLGSAFIGDKRIAVVFVKDGLLYIKAVGQGSTPTSVTLGNSVALFGMEMIYGGTEDFAEVIGFQSAAAVICAISGSAFAVFVTFNGLTATVQYTEVLNASNARCLCGCAMEDRKALICHTQNKVLTHYPSTVNLNAEQSNFVSILEQMYNTLSKHDASGLSWDEDSEAQQSTKDLISWYCGTGGYSGHGVRNALSETDMALPSAQKSDVLIGSFDWTTGEFCPLADSPIEVDYDFHAFATYANVFENEAKNALREAGTTTETVREQVYHVVAFGETAATVNTAPLSSAYWTWDEYAQGWSVTALNPQQAVLGRFKDHNHPIEFELLNFGVNQAGAGKCITAESMPCVSLVALTSDCVGVACAVKRVEGNNTSDTLPEINVGVHIPVDGGENDPGEPIPTTVGDTLLTFEGWYLDQDLGAQPMFWGAEDRSQGTNISRVYADKMGTNFVLLTCVLDNKLCSTLVALKKSSPDGNPTIQMGETTGYARLHPMNGTFTLGAVQRGSDIRAVAHKRQRTVVKTDLGGDVSGMASGNGTPGGNVEIYSA